MSFKSSTAAKAAKDVILSDSRTYYQWYKETRGSVPNHLWRYFDPDGEAAFIEPVSPTEPVNEPPSTTNNSAGAAHGTRSSLAPTETPERQMARQGLIREQMEVYFKRHAIYGDMLRQWEEYNECEAKLREQILATVAQQKAAPLVSQNTVRKLLINLRASTEPPKVSTSVRPLSMKYQCISIELHAIGVAGTAPKMEGVAA